MNKAKTIKKLNDMVAKARKSENFAELEQFCLSPEYQSLSYAEKNYPFITASKLKAFARCELAYKYEYIDLVQKPEDWEQEDYFVTGSAFDDLMTLGEDYYQERYIKMDRRISDIQAEKEKAENAIKDALEAPRKKDGSMYASDQKKIGQAKERLALCALLESKVQITETIEKQIRQMQAEFIEQPLFNQTPKKRVIIAPLGQHLLKAELDDFEPGVRINDIKTAANILRFDYDAYLLQGCFYNFLVEEVDGDRLPVRLEIVDKHKCISRSLCVEYTTYTLQSQRAQMLNLITGLQDCLDTDIWSPTKVVQDAANSPYYGYKGYGRQTQVIYY